MTRILRILFQGLRALSRNKGRSALTILGIVIGIGSVIALISIGNGARNSINSRIASLGSTNIIITSGQSQFSSTSSQKNSSASSSSSSSTASDNGPGGGGGGSRFAATSRPTLTQGDLDAIRAQAKSLHVSVASGYLSNIATFTLLAKDSSGNTQQANYSVVGTDQYLFPIQQLTAHHGRLLDASDVSNSTKVIVIGDSVASDLFGNENPIGKTLVVQNDTYTVVGVLNHKDSSAFTNPNAQLYIPYTSAQGTFQVENLASIYTQAVSQNDVNAAKSALNNLLLQRHDKTPSTADFSVVDSQDLLSAVDQITGILTALLGGIAGISLVVGGIGIMNIMLVAVTERTREIGLRKALGARTGDIMLQFVFESILLTLVGGIIGIILGFLLGTGMSHFLNGIKPDVTMGSILLAVSVSTIIGLVFGIYPAAKAARLNPIDALRYE